MNGYNPAEELADLLIVPRASWIGLRKFSGTGGTPICFPERAPRQSGLPPKLNVELSPVFVKFTTDSPMFKFAAYRIRNDTCDSFTCRVAVAGSPCNACVFTTLVTLADRTVRYADSAEGTCAPTLESAFIGRQ